MDQQERHTWVKLRVKDIQIELGSHKISKNQQYRMNVNGAQDTPLNKRRIELTQELLTLEKELHTFNITKKDRFTSPDYSKNIYDILKETFGKEEALKITREALTRTAGNDPNKIILNYGFSQTDKETIKRLTKIAADLKEKLLSARKSIDRYIRQNEPEVNKADYLNKVKCLSQSMPPEKEIYTIKIN